MASAALFASGCPGPPDPHTRAAMRAGGLRSIAVVGGGLAGLVCANELVHGGYPVQLLEAKARPGGRIATVRTPWSEGLYAEAGARFFVGDSRLVQLCQSSKLTFAARGPRPTLQQIRLFGGERSLLAPGEEPAPEYALSDEEQRIGEQGRMDKYFGLAKTFDPRAPLPAALASYDRMSGAEFLRAQGASEGFVAMIDGRVGLGPRGIAGMSALSLLQVWACIFEEIGLGSRKLEGGSDRLPEALAAELGERIHYSAEVQRVQNVAKGVRVSYLQHGEPKELTVDRVVLAIPPGVLTRLTIVPRLSEAKQRALSELELESVTHVWFETDSRFWVARGESGGAESDLPLGGLRDESATLPGQRGLLAVVAVRQQSQLLSAMSEDERIEAALRHAERFHPDLRRHVTAAASQCWDNDRFQRGAYAFFQPGQLTSAVHLGKAEGNLHFAGDHTSYRPGFMHGALASAYRVVDEIYALDR